jgi:hypothetical protein
MAGIVFYFEEYDTDVWSGRDIDMDAWKYNSKIADIDKVYIINRTDETIKWFDYTMDIQIVDEMPKLEGHVTQLVVPSEVVKYNKESVSLWDFDHKTDWYVFGPANGWGGDHFGDTLLSIPHNNNVHHHSVFVASTVMYHRYENIKNNL